MEEQAPLETHSPANLIEFQSLDPRIVQVWRIAGLIFCGILLFFSLIGVVITGLKEPATRPWIFIGWFLIAAFLLWLCLMIPPRRYRYWGYRIDDKVLETRHGRLFQITRLLPLNRLQHVDLQRGPLERLFGLSRLILHTAGTHNASITVPGLAQQEAERLRQHLVDLGGGNAI